MALCSQAFSTSNKRSCTFNTASFEASPAKRACLGNLKGKGAAAAEKELVATPTRTSRRSGSFAAAARRAPPMVVNGTKPALLNNMVCYSSTSESEADSDDEQSCYNADQVKAKRRASTRVSFSLSCNSELSKAISKYSDDDDEEDNSDVNHHDDDNIDCKLTSSPCASSILPSTSNSKIVAALSSSNINIQDAPYHRHNSMSGTNSASFLQISDQAYASQSSRKSIPESDKQSRSRCFEYLVGAIDEAWARYCDATTYVEDEVYGYNTPASVATDDEDYFGNTTDFTDYESDYEVSKSSTTTNKSSVSGTARPQRGMYTPASPAASTTSASSSKDPSSCRLQALKDRLTKAKYFLQDLVDSDDCNDANAFWKRWDMIKYATIELVEDDDDDEVIESTIEELEDGRLFVN